MEASGAKRDIVDELRRACDGFAPFAEYAVKDFARFLVRAEEYSRTGIIPVQGKAPSKPRATKPKVPALTLEDAKALVTSLYDRAISEDVSYDHIGAEVQKLDKLTASDLKEIAKHFGVVPGKTKKASLDAILEKISRRKATHARTQF